MRIQRRATGQERARGRQGVVGAAALLAALAAAGPAQAATVRVVDGERVVFTAAPGEANRVSLSEVPASVPVPTSVTPPQCWPSLYPYGGIYCWEPGSVEYTYLEADAVLVEDTGAPVATSDTTCVPSGEHSALCHVDGRASFTFTLGDRDDVLTTSLPAQVDGGAGNDDLTSAGAIDGGAGADRIRGGQASYRTRTSAVTVANDGLANDGEPGEGDDVSVIAVEGGAGPDRITGFSGAAGGPGADVLVAGSDHSMLFGGDGDDTVTGGAGFDRLVGDGGRDTLTGGPGGDVITGGAGDDSLTGGPDGDLLNGGAGRDTLSVSGDGAMDGYNCGPNGGTVSADPTDYFHQSGTIDTDPWTYMEGDGTCGGSKK